MLKQTSRLLKERDIPSPNREETIQVHLESVFNGSTICESCRAIFPSPFLLLCRRELIFLECRGRREACCEQKNKRFELAAEEQIVLRILEGDQVPPIGEKMLELLLIILLVCWLGGFGFGVGGGLIHILLVIFLVALVLRFLQGGPWFRRGDGLLV